MTDHVLAVGLGPLLPFGPQFSQITSAVSPLPTALQSSVLSESVSTTDSSTSTSLDTATTSPLSATDSTASATSIVTDTNTASISSTVSIIDPVPLTSSVPTTSSAPTTNSASDTITTSDTTDTAPFTIAFNSSPSSTATSSSTSGTIESDQPTTSTHLVIHTSFIAPSAAPVTSSAVASRNTNTAAIVGGVAGGSVVIIGLILLFAFCLRRNRKDGIANFDPQEFRHSGKELIDDDAIDHTFSFPRPTATIERLHVPSRMPTFRPQYDAPGRAYNRGSQYSVYTENHAGFGSHTGSQARRAADRAHHAASSSYKPSPSRVPVPSTPYPEQHYDQRVPPHLVVQNESAPPNDYRATRNVRGSPDLPPLPPQPEELLHNGHDRPLPSQSSDVSPFSDPSLHNIPVSLTPAYTASSRYGVDSFPPNKVEPRVAIDPTLPPLDLNIRSVERKHSITRSVYGSEEDAYTGIS